MQNNPSPQNSRAADGLASNRALSAPALVIDVVYRDGAGRLLSNPAPTPFVMARVQFASVEALIQGIKFPFADPARRQTFQLSGYEAKRAGLKMSEKIALQYAAGAVPTVYWDGEELPFRGPQHRALIAEAIRAKFTQNAGARDALLATGSALLVHSIADMPYTSLPAADFVQLLNEVRADLMQSNVKRQPSE